VSHIVGEMWLPDGGAPDECPESYAVTFARQFRYDAARARYLNRELDTSDFSVVVSDTWSDYDGDEIYGDFTLSGSTATNQRSFQPGIATVGDPWASSGGASTKYYHADLIGTTRIQSTSGGTTGSAVHCLRRTPRRPQPPLRLRRRLAIPGTGLPCDSRDSVPARRAPLLRSGRRSISSARPDRNQRKRLRLRSNPH